MIEKKRILVVDDEPQVTRLMKMALEQTNKYEVREAASGAGALQTARTFHPHLMLLDIIMPGIDGSRVAQQMRDDPALAQIKVIFLTATVTPDEVDEQQGAIGGYAFIAKPILVSRVVELVGQHLAS